MILVIDNYDSFVNNLARYIRESGSETLVIRNDSMSIGECLALSPEGIVISPGPRRPEDAKISCDLIKALDSKTPLLGSASATNALLSLLAGERSAPAFRYMARRAKFATAAMGCFEAFRPQ